MAFKKLREQRIPALNATFQEFEHEASGARHIHLSSESSENVFLAAFPTIPDTDDGRAHILEHLALCGSERYPARDPFFAMTRRSLASFMNAMTYPDRTVYPFATLDKKDYFNLLGVYLDAAFFPKLDYLDFRQEGWRYEIEDGKLAYQGVVFNEMKGALASPGRAVYHGMEAALKKGTTYERESGGDPLAIPELSYEALKAFHATHYHPSRSVFMSYGDIPAEDIQNEIEARVISRVPTVLPRIHPQLAAPMGEPRLIDIPFPSQSAREDEHAFQCAWLLGEITDARAQSDAQILEQALFGDAASPMIMALESAGFGRPSSLLGVDTSNRQMSFHIGMEGLTPEQIPQAREVIFNALAQIAEQGIPQERLGTILRDFEISSREVSGSGQPYGLSLLLNALPVEMNGGDALGAFDNEPQLELARQRVQDPDFIKAMARGLIESSSRVEARVAPDAEFFAQREAAEAANLARAEASLTAEQRAQIQAESEQLKARQRQEADLSSLPRISPSEVSREIKEGAQMSFVAGESGPSKAVSEIGSNGVSYLSIHFDATAFPAEDWKWVSLYAEMITELGLGELSYDQAQLWRHSKASTFGSNVSAVPSAFMDDSALLRVSFSTKGLRREIPGMAEMLAQSIQTARFDESERLSYLLESMYQDELQAVARKGGSHAASDASAPFSTLGSFHNQISGREALAFHKELSDSAKTAEGMGRIQSKLQEIHRRTLGSPCMVAASGSLADANEAADALIGRFAGFTPLPAIEGSGARIYVERDQTRLPSHALSASSQINHCYLAFKAPQTGHEDAPAMAVLAQFLKNGFLHRALREEGGAYGGSASYSASGHFTLSSYRDPRLTGTYEDFRASLRWMMEEAHGQEALEEAIISVVQGMDKPSSPKGEANAALARAQSGVTREIRERYRAGVLGCSIERLLECAQKYLIGAPASQCAFVGAAGKAEAIALGMSVIELDPAAGRAPGMKR